MIVDDDPDVRYLLRAILEDAHLDIVAEAASADDTMAQLDGADPDVIVLDAAMPLHDGFETAALILARRPGQPILLCPALVDEVVEERARAAGIAACLPKDGLDAIPPAVEALGRREG
jgi:CheY-like chemotaxis protein